MPNQQEQDFTYALNWREKTKATRIECPKCCVCFRNQSTTVHHLYYRRSLARRIFGMLLFHNPFAVSISGYEIPGWDIVPVCELHHENYYGRSNNPSSVHYTGKGALKGGIGRGAKWIQRGGLLNSTVGSFRVRLRVAYFSISFVTAVVRFFAFIFAAKFAK